MERLSFSQLHQYSMSVYVHIVYQNKCTVLTTRRATYDLFSPILAEFIMVLGRNDG